MASSPRETPATAAAVFQAAARNRDRWAVTPPMVSYTVVTGTCGVCGKEFDQTVKVGSEVDAAADFCSKACRREAKRQRRAARPVCPTPAKYTYLTRDAARAAFHTYTGTGKRPQSYYWCTVHDGYHVTSKNLGRNHR